MDRARLTWLVSLALALPGALMIADLAQGATWAMDLLHPSGEMAVRLVILAMLAGPVTEIGKAGPDMGAGERARRAFEKRVVEITQIGEISSAGARQHAESFSWSATAAGLIDSYAQAISRHVLVSAAAGGR